MAGIVCTALSLSAATADAGPSRAADLWALRLADAPARAASAAIYAAGTAAILGATAAGRLTFGQSAAAAISLGTLCTLCAQGSFGGPPAMAGRRLRSPEFLLQYFWILWVMTFIFSDTATTLREGCAAHPECAGRLSGGSDWLYTSLGLRFVDRSDAQWSFFREQLPLLSGVAAMMLLRDR